MTDEYPTFEDVISESATGAIRKMQERLEYELRGAWRAGYDWLHVYSDNPTASLGADGDPFEDGITITRYVYPSYSDRPRLLEDDEVIYRYSYDLTSVPDDVLRRAIRGEELDGEAIREVRDE